MAKEIWKDIPGYEGFYQASTEGRVRSVDRIVKKWDGKKLVKGRVLIPATNLHGYLFVELFKDGVGKIKTIHRVVAETFLPNPDSLPQINHKDEDKTNNRVDNLEWCDMAYNIGYGTNRERAAQKMRKSVLVKNQDGSEYGRYPSLDSVSIAVGRCKSAICGYIKNGGVSPLGLIFQYL